MTYEDLIAMPSAERAALRRRDQAAYDLLVITRQLKSLAKQTSPGPWYRSHGCVTASCPRGPGGQPIPKPEWERFLFSIETEGGLNGTQADARWVTAACPDRVGRLMDAAAEVMRERDALRAQAEAMLAERDALLGKIEEMAERERV